MSTTNAKNHPHDKRAVKAFLMHIAGELRVQECAFHDKPVSPALPQGVNQFRSKFGILCILSPDTDDGSVASQEAMLQAVASWRLEQLKHVMAVIALLEQVETLQLS